MVARKRQDEETMDIFEKENEGRKSSGIKIEGAVRGMGNHC